MPTQAQKAETMKALHEGGETFLIPGPWDIASARVFEALGFKALATTSGGLAYALGKLDGQVTLEEKAAHCRALSEATSIPITADLENGYAHDADGVAETIRHIAGTGVVGGSIEDWNGEDIYDFNHAVERIEAAVEAARSLDFPFAVIGRCENLLRKKNDMDDTIRRLKAYEAAGVDVLFAPGLRTAEEVRTVVDEISKPLSVVAMNPDLTLAALAEAGARRVSVGGGMAVAAYGTLVDGAREMKEDGTFTWMKGITAENAIEPLLKKG
ncbi:oxaloacetate decarboxylase [Lutimaribacter marinistellae]|uniref:Oxaloacetate decarboxylase n=1 Tax=Lutimaribacter marinistellae TaxID=1820329 RepID=A0ABV7TCB7_9RHOB